MDALGNVTNKTAFAMRAALVKLNKDFMTVAGEFGHESEQLTLGLCWARDLLAERLQKTQERIARDCNSWFDGSCLADPLTPCPVCGSDDTGRYHADGTLAMPETSYHACNECGHQWGHE